MSVIQSILNELRSIRKYVEMPVYVVLFVLLGVFTVILWQWKNFQLSILLTVPLAAAAGFIMAHFLGQDIWPVDRFVFMLWLMAIPKTFIDKNPEMVLLTIIIGFLWAGVKLRMLFESYDHPAILHPTIILFALCAIGMNAHGLLDDIPALAIVTISGFASGIIAGLAVMKYGSDHVVWVDLGFVVCWSFVTVYVANNLPYEWLMNVILIGATYTITSTFMACATRIRNGDLTGFTIEPSDS